MCVASEGLLLRNFLPTKTITPASAKNVACRGPRLSRWAMCRIRGHAQKPKSEEPQFYVQEFFRVLAEIVDHETEITRKRGHIVVESRIGEKLSDRALI
jgi:hypothetical protein